MHVSFSSSLGNPDGDKGRDGGVEYFLLYPGRLDLCLELDETDDLRRLLSGRRDLCDLLGDCGEVGVRGASIGFVDVLDT